jgi:hypothetical protein
MAESKSVYKLYEKLKEGKLTYEELSKYMVPSVKIRFEKPDLKLKLRKD